MKNKLFLFIITISCLIIVGCKSKVDLEGACYKKVSEERKNFYLCEIDDLVLTFSSGYREKDYNMNSNHCGENVEFGLLTLYSKTKSYLEVKNAKFTLISDDETYEGVFEKNPYDGSLVYDTGLYINTDVLMSKIIINNENISFNLVNVSRDWGVGAEDAFKIACVKNTSILSKYLYNNEFQGEVYIKVSYNFSLDLDMQWFIKFLMKDKIISTIIDKNSGNIISNVVQ